MSHGRPGHDALGRPVLMRAAALAIERGILGQLSTQSGRSRERWQPSKSSHQCAPPPLLSTHEAAWLFI